MPDDTVSAESAAGWAYREADNDSKAGGKAKPNVKVVAQGTKRDGVFATATEVFILGATAAGFAALATMRLLEVPMAAGRLIIPDKYKSARVSEPTREP